MFYSIPVSNKQIITTTPIGAKSVSHIFFENKNDGAFRYSADTLDNVTVTLAGRMICRQVPIAPFMTSSTYGVARHNWQDVALEAGINVDMSEIRISANAINDFNVVLVYSDKEIEKTNGFDYVEAKRFRITFPDAESKTIKEAKQEAIGKRNRGEFTYHKGNVLPREMVGTDMDADFGTIDDDGDHVWLFNIVELKFGGYLIEDDSYTEGYYFDQVVGDPLYYAGFNTEHTISLDREPTRVFAYQQISYSTVRKPSETLITSDMSLKFTLSGSEEEELPSYADLSIIEAKDDIAWRKVAYDFSSPVSRSPRITYDVQSVIRNGQVVTKLDSSNCASFSKQKFPSSWDLVFVFMYKKF